MRKRRFWQRAFWGLLVAIFIIVAPCAAWTPEIFSWWQVPLGVLFFILSIGVLLFDTFFFDRYR